MLGEKIDRESGESGESREQNRVSIQPIFYRPPSFESMPKSHHRNNYPKRIINGDADGVIGVAGGETESGERDVISYFGGYPNGCDLRQRPYKWNLFFRHIILKILMLYRKRLRLFQKPDSHISQPLLHNELVRREKMR